MGCLFETGRGRDCEVITTKEGIGVEESQVNGL